MTDARCQAVALDAAIMLGARHQDETAVTPCDAIGDVDVDGYMLCADCAEAVETLVALGGAVLRKRGTDMLKDAFGDTPKESP